MSTVPAQVRSIHQRSPQRPTQAGPVWFPSQPRQRRTPPAKMFTLSYQTLEVLRPLWTPQGRCPAHPAHPSPAGAQGMLLGLEVVWGWCPSASSAGTVLWCLTHSLVTLCSPRASKPGSFTTNSLSAPLLVLNPKGVQGRKHLG